MVKKAREVLEAVPIPQAQAAGAIAGVAEGVVDRAKTALTTPIYSRKVTEHWDAEKQEWVPDTRTKEASVTPAAIIAVPAAAVGAAVALYAVGMAAEPREAPVMVPNPDHDRWVREGGNQPPSFYGPRPAREAEPPKFIPDPSGATKTRLAFVKRPRILINYGAGGGSNPANTPILSGIFWPLTLGRILGGLRK